MVVPQLKAWHTWNLLQTVWCGLCGVVRSQFADTVEAKSTKGRPAPREDFHDPLSDLLPATAVVGGTGQDQGYSTSDVSPSDCIPGIRDMATRPSTGEGGGGKKEASLIESFIPSFGG